MGAGRELLWLRSKGSLQAPIPRLLGKHPPGPPPTPQVAAYVCSQLRIEKANIPLQNPRPNILWATRGPRLNALGWVFYKKKANHLFLQTCPQRPKSLFSLGLRLPQKTSLFLSPQLTACAFFHPTSYFRNLCLPPKGSPLLPKRPGWVMKSGAGGTGLAV